MKMISIIILMLAFVLIIPLTIGYSLLLTNTNSESIAVFTDAGRIRFTGSCITETNVCDAYANCVYGGTCDNPSGLILKDSTDTINTYMNISGGMCTAGDLDSNVAPSTMETNCATDSFHIRDNNSVLRACIDSSGNIYADDFIFCDTVCDPDCGAAAICSGRNICVYGEACDNANDCASEVCTSSICE